MYTVTTYSNRFYVDNDGMTEFAKQSDDTIYKFNGAVYYTYNLLYYKQFNKDRYDELIGADKSTFLHIRNKFGYNTYYTNSIVNIAEGKLKSQISNNKNYIQQTKEQIKVVEDKIDKTAKKLNDLIKMRERIVGYEQQLKCGKPVKFKSVKSLPFVRYDSGEILFTYNHQTYSISLYKFEYEYLNKEIRRLRNLLGKYKHRLDNLNHKLIRLAKMKPIIFGSRKYISDYCKGKYNRQQFENKKYSGFDVSGRHDFPMGNRIFIANYNSDTDSFDFTIRFLSEKTLILNNVRFPYRQQSLLKILNRETVDNEMKAICFGIHKKIDNVSGKTYYQIKTSFDIESTLQNINYSVESGIIGIDFNLGHLDICEIDGKGNILNTKTIYYDIYSSTGENELSLRKALDEIGQYATSKHKIIAVEDVNTYKSNFKLCKDKTKQRKLNKALHSLPHAKYLKYVNYLKIKYEIDVRVVKPQFTSIIGKLKYSDHKKLNAHISASYVIGRRALGFKEKPLKSQIANLPIELLNSNEWKRWSYLNKI